MNCPKCGHNKTTVLNTCDKGRFTVRYRKCLRCKWRFTSKEMLNDGWNDREILKKIKKYLEDVDLK